MLYNFDEEIDRSGTSCVKWETRRDERNHSTKILEVSEDVTPMWVADMDFCSPKPVVDALIKRASHGLYGYTYECDSYYEAVIKWVEKRNHWQIKKEWVVTTPGVIPALNMIVQTFAEPGDKVLIQTPAYHPFFDVIRNNQLEIVENPLNYQGITYTMDFNDLEKKTRDPGVKIAILCHPHNPVGRVWKREEILRFGEICLANNTLVVSDEIHSDLIYPGVEFIPFASLRNEFAENGISCIAPSKTFNLAGLKTSTILIANSKLRERFEKTLKRNGLGTANLFGILALEVAYNEGEIWLDQLLAYLDGNRQYLETFAANNLPKIKVIHPEGTYLVWIDCRELGLNSNKLVNFFIKNAKIYVESGDIFGKNGDGFIRINIACPRPVLARALDRLKDALNII